MIQTIANRLRFVAQTIVKRIKQMTRPANGSSASNLVMDLARSKHDLLVENALLRQQLIVLERRQKRPQLSNWDRIKLICLARLTPNWKDALHIVQPDTLLRWHRDLFRFVWRRKSKPKGRRRRISQETIDLIRQMASKNLTWGAERIRGELLKLCISLSKPTILIRDNDGKYGHLHPIFRWLLARSSPCRCSAGSTMIIGVLHDQKQRRMSKVASTAR